jgi:hypothetical protein
VPPLGLYAVAAGASKYFVRADRAQAFADKLAEQQRAEDGALMTARSQSLAGVSVEMGEVASPSEAGHRLSGSAHADAASARPLSPLSRSAR